MTSRATVAIATLVIVLGACNGAAPEEASTTTQPPPASTTTTAEQAFLVSYSLDAGTTMTYDVEFEVAMSMTVTGDASELTDGEDLPGALDMIMTGESTFTYEIEDGPEAGTYEITITGDFTVLEVTGTADGEPIGPETIPELVEMEPVEVTVVVDDQGRVVGDLGPAGLMGGSFGELVPSPGSELARFVGPPLPEGEVEVGSAWSETIETPMFIGDPITTTIDSEVTDIDANGIVHIETRTVVSEISFDMGAFLVEMFEAFIPEDATEEDLAELESLKEELRFLLLVDETAGFMTTLFDPSLGLAVEATSKGDTHLTMDVNMPDETTGEMVAFGIEMGISQNVTYRLIDPSR